MFPKPSSWRIVRGDLVQVMTGKDKGKSGEVLRVIRDQRFPRVFVQGINMITRRVRKQADSTTGTSRPGFTVKMEAPIHYSNVMLVDPQTKKPVRSYFKFEDTAGGKRVRFTRGRNASNCIVPWPRKWLEDRKADVLVGEKDTAPEVAEEASYHPEADFNLVLPSAHTRLRELRGLREAAAAARAAAQRQQWQQHRALLFRSKAAAGAAGGGRGGSGSRSSSGAAGVGSVDAAPSSRSFSSSASGGSTASSRVAVASLIPLLQSRLVLSSSGSSSTCHRQLQWCGLAAAPLVAASLL